MPDFCIFKNFNTTWWIRFNSLYRIDNRGILYLQSSNSNYLFQNTFSYKVWSNDIKLQISLNLLISWLHICILTALMTKWHKQTQAGTCIYLLKNDCIDWAWQKSPGYYKLSTSALLECCLSRHLKCLDCLLHWSKSKGTFWGMAVKLFDKVAQLEQEIWCSLQTLCLWPG